MGTGLSGVLLAIHSVVATFVLNLSDNLVYTCNFSDLFQEVQGFKQRGLLTITQLVSGLHGGLKVLSMGQWHIMARCWT